jgi:hypothetical protein
MVDGWPVVFAIYGGDDATGPVILSRSGSTVFAEMDTVAVSETP